MRRVVVNRKQVAVDKLAWRDDLENVLLEPLVRHDEEAGRVGPNGQWREWPRAEGGLSSGKTRQMRSHAPFIARFRTLSASKGTGQSPSSIVRSSSNPARGNGRRGLTHEFSTRHRTGKSVRGSTCTPVIIIALRALRDQINTTGGIMRRLSRLTASWTNRKRASDPAFRASTWSRKRPRGLATLCRGSRSQYRRLYLLQSGSRFSMAPAKSERVNDVPSGRPQRTAG